MRSPRNACVVGLLLAAVSCGGPTGATTVVADKAGDPTSVLPAIPAKIDAKRIVPDSSHAPQAQSKLLDIMAEENARWAKALRASPIPAYFIAYTITELHVVHIQAEGGGLVDDTDEVQRVLDVEVRVGDERFDNRRILGEDRLAAFTFLPREGRVPFGEDPKAIKTSLWLETDRRYREAAITLRNLQTQQNVSTEGSKAPDFSHQKVEYFVEQPVALNVAKKSWKARMRDCSKKARRGVATRSSCSVDVRSTTTYYVNSEGSRIQTSHPTARLSVSVGIKADDGMNLGRTEDRFARTADTLPTDAEIERMIKTVTDELDELEKSSVVDPYVGPAILEGRAAAVFFHEVFGHRIEGHRQKDPNFGKTFTDKVGKVIMPEWLSVYDDPTISSLNTVELNGFYRFDDEGVRAQRASLVENGVLKGFVQGRTPLESFPSSNGHGRRHQGLPAVSRQGNLVVETERSVTSAELRKMLIEELKAQGKPYGMIFTDISGGYTNTSQFTAQHFKVMPTMAYRLYPDGRTELVRGVDIVGLPLTVLASIKAAARPVEIFNGMCGAESGWVPVSASAPSLLLDKVEVERSFKGSNSPPVLRPPGN